MKNHNINKLSLCYLVMLLFVVLFSPKVVQAQQTPSTVYSLIRIYATTAEVKTIQDKGLIYVLGINSNHEFVDAEVQRENIPAIKKMVKSVDVIIDDLTTHHEAKANLIKSAKGKKPNKKTSKNELPNG
jgi:hypothetical protein